MTETNQSGSSWLVGWLGRSLLGRRVW